jgi:hypothetical protein
MSVDYSKYLDQHIYNVYKGYDWIRDNVPDVLEGYDCEFQIRYMHDNTKFDVEEYDAYDQYFYGGKKTAEVKENFNLAWLHHIHNNPHHWQHWILINDNPGEGMVILDMPHNYIIEMVCDWWAFSWNKGNLYEIFNWYDQHKAYMKLSDKTRKTVEDILTKLKAKLDEMEG